MISAFGVEDSRIAKADGDTPQRPKWHNTRWEPTAKERAQGPEPKPARSPGAYVPGSITLHHEQAQLHGRKKAAANRTVRTGSTIAGTGLALGVAAHQAAHPIAQAVTPTARQVGTRTHEVQLARNVRRVRIAGIGGGLAAAGVGGGVATAGAIARARHGRAQNASTRAAQEARRKRAEDKDWSA